MTGQDDPVMRVRAFGARTEGSIAPLTGVALAVLLGFAGFGIDLGQVYLEKRHVQSAADLAALAGARSLGNTAVVTQSLTDNGYPTPGALSVTLGVFTPDPSLAPTTRFSAGGSTPNAVRVSLSSSVKAGFSRALGGPAGYTVSGNATALRANLAAFGVGSRLASLNAGILNGLLSAMLGTNVSLSLVSYQALAGLNIDALAFLQAAATRANLQAVTFNDVLHGSLSPIDLTSTLATVAGTTSGGAQAASALQSLAGALSGSGGRIALANLLTVGELGPWPLTTSGQPLLVNALGLLTGAAVIANGTNQASVDLGSAIPGLLKTRVTLRVGQAWQTSGYVGTGASLNTAQTRALVEVWLTGPIGLASLYLPLYVELAQASATLQSLTCPWSMSSERTVSLGVSTGAAYLAIGSLSGSLDPTAPRPYISPAVIVQVTPLLNITGAAALPIGTSTQTLTFSDTDISAVSYKTVSANNLVGSLTSGLLTNLTLGVNGTSGGVPAILQAPIATALGQASSSIDGLLFSLFGSLGLRIGSADVAVTGTSCGGAVLVQ